jgi:type IV secretion system protein VirB9
MSVIFRGHAYFDNEVNMKTKPTVMILTVMGVLLFSLNASGEDLAKKYFSNNKLVLTPQEKAAITIAKKWEASTADMDPVIGPNGSVRYLFGAQLPSIACAVLQVTDIELQPGETVNNIHLGDKVRWTVDPAVTGSGPGQTLHLIIKPWDVGLETGLVVTTNRRTYHFKLRSFRKEHMRHVSFVYPEDALAKWDLIRSREEQEIRDNTIPRTGEYLGELNFEYDLAGSTSWKPVRVYNDGRKTIIQMPKTMAQTEAPTLLVVRENNGLFSKDETVLVNYRLQNDRYIVDTVFDKAILIAGVGSNQARITITRRK